MRTGIIIMAILSSVIVFTFGLSLFEREFGLKQEDSVYHKILYIFYKVSFFITFCALYILVFLLLSSFIIDSFCFIQNASLRSYLLVVSILCLNIHGGNVIYLILKFSLYDRFKHHKIWITISKDIIIHIYRFIIYLCAFIILFIANIFSFLNIESSLRIFTENISVLNIAFATVLGFDVMCDAGVKAMEYFKSLLLKAYN